MSFISLQFVIFLPLVFLIYWVMPAKWQWIVILIASYYFYMSWNIKYVVLILGTTVISYLSAILIDKSTGDKNRKIIIILCSGVCMGILFVFKYFNFAVESLTNIGSLIGLHIHPVTLTLLLPVGISFYTFQTLGYVIDVYRGKINAERHFGKYAAFISFFPQLVAGPIERTENLLPQIKKEHKFDYHDGILGIRQMIWGFFMKVCIADTLAVYSDKIFDSPNTYSGGGISHSRSFLQLSDIL